MRPFTALFHPVMLAIAVQGGASSGQIPEQQPKSPSYQIPEEPPDRVEVSDLVRRALRYTGELVIVVGELASGDDRDAQNQVFELRDQRTFQTVRVGMPWGSRGELRVLQGYRVEVVGIFWDLDFTCYKVPREGWKCGDRRLIDYPGALRDDIQAREDRRYFIGAQVVDALEGDLLPKEPKPTEDVEEPDIDIAPGIPVDLRDLVKDPTAYSGERIAVIGKFRGNNLYGDLSVGTKKTPRDFVIKVAEAAIWVTGKHPHGKGFELDPRMRRDTGQWLKVTGVPWLDNGMVYLRAERLEIEPKPEDPDLEPVETVETVEKPRVKLRDRSPKIIFTLPLDGERDIPLDTAFHVQFSKDMKPESFEGKVELLYMDESGTGKPLAGMEIRYDDATRALVVNPGSRLDPGKKIRLILYEGIGDKNGIPVFPRLLSRRASLALGAHRKTVVVLTFFTRSEAFHP